MAKRKARKAFEPVRLIDVIPRALGKKLNRRRLIVLARTKIFENAQAAVVKAKEKGRMADIDEVVNLSITALNAFITVQEKKILFFELIETHPDLLASGASLSSLQGLIAKKRRLITETKKELVLWNRRKRIIDKHSSKPD